MSDLFTRAAAVEQCVAHASAKPTMISQITKSGWRGVDDVRFVPKGLAQIGQTIFVPRQRVFVFEGLSLLVGVDAIALENEASEKQGSLCAIRSCPLDECSTVQMGPMLAFECVGCGKDDRGCAVLDDPACVVVSPYAQAEKKGMSDHGHGQRDNGEPRHRSDRVT